MWTFYKINRKFPNNLQIRIFVYNILPKRLNMKFLTDIESIKNELQPYLIY